MTFYMEDDFDCDHVWFTVLTENACAHFGVSIHNRLEHQQCSECDLVRYDAGDGWEIDNPNNAQYLTRYINYCNDFTLSK